MAKYPWKTKPYKHQIEAIRFLLSTGWGGALLMEPRTGKTKSVIDYLSILALQGKCDRAVIVCPARVMDVWVEEFFVHCPIRYQIHVWDRDGRKSAIPKVQAVHQLTILLVNYDAFATPGRRIRNSRRRSKTTGRFAHRTQIQRWIGSSPCAGVLDESHKIKSPTGKAATMLVSMRGLFEYRVIMTGTPVTKAKRVFDIQQQWRFLNPDRFADYHTAAEFKQHFGVWITRNGFPQFLRPANLEELKERIHQDSYAITRAECFDLPPSQTFIRRVPLTTSGPVYDDLAKKMVAEFERAKRTHLTEASIPLVLTLRLSQVTGGFAKTDEGETVQVGTEKLDELCGILEEIYENEEKVVVCARFRSDLDAIIAAGQRLGFKTYQIRGGMTRQDMTRNISTFKRVDGASLIAMNPQAGGLGIDLSSASIMVWYSLTPSWVDFTQAKDRIALSATSTSYYYILAENSVDEILFDTLKKDGDIAAEIVKNPRRVFRK